MSTKAALHKHLASVLTHFPKVQHAVAYGSGVHLQPGLYEDASPEKDGSQPAGPVQEVVKSPNGSRPMIDHIFAVQDPESWHAEVRHALVGFFHAFDNYPRDLEIRDTRSQVCDLGDCACCTIPECQSEISDMSEIDGHTMSGMIIHTQFIQVKNF